MTKPTNNTLYELVESLLAKTREGRLDWFSAASSFVYGVAFPFFLSDNPAKRPSRRAGNLHAYHP